MTRMVGWLAVAVTFGKWLASMALVFACGRQKDALLRELAATTRWGGSDPPRTFRNRDKNTGANFWNSPAHLYDRALFDAADTVKRWIESAVAIASIKAKLMSKLDEGAQWHYAFWLLKKGLDACKSRVPSVRPS